MLRKFIILGILGTGVGVGLGVHYLGSALKQEQAILEWSNALVSKTLGLSHAPGFSLLQVRSGGQPDHWIVAGTLTLPEEKQFKPESPFEAVIRRVCASRTSERCWRLERLTIDGKAMLGALGNTREPMETVSVPRDAPVESLGLESTNSVATSTKRSSPTPMAEIDVASPGPPPEERAAPNRGQFAEGPDIGKRDQTSVTGPSQKRQSTGEGPAAIAASPPEKTAQANADLDITNGRENELVLRIQRSLNKHRLSGSRPLRLDGEMGPRTRSAIRAYQQANGLNPTGQPSRDLLAHLEANTQAKPARANASLHRENGRDLVMSIQRALNRQGFGGSRPLGLDGEMGPRTRRAILAYQQANDLPPTGQPSEELLANLKANTQSMPKSGLKLQLGAFSVMDNARRAWQTLHRQHQDLLGDLDHSIAPTRDGGLHLLLAGPLPDASTAAARCAALEERGVDCLVVRR